MNSEHTPPPIAAWTGRNELSRRAYRAHRRYTESNMRSSP